MRLDYTKYMNSALQGMYEIQRAVDKSSLDPKLLELVKIRASQINSCAFCIDMHTKDSRALGETEQRINLLSAWRESPFYSPRERAALAWCESVTLLNKTGVPDAVYNEIKKAFTPEEIVELTYSIVIINSWNRLCVSMRTPAGDYVSKHK